VDEARTRALPPGTKLVVEAPGSLLGMGVLVRVKEGDASPYPVIVTLDGRDQQFRFSEIVGVVP
jgi:hypothetical protein